MAFILAADGSEVPQCAHLVVQIFIDSTWLILLISIFFQ